MKPTRICSFDVLEALRSEVSRELPHCTPERIKADGDSGGISSMEKVRVCQVACQGPQVHFCRMPRRPEPSRLQHDLCTAAKKEKSKEREGEKESFLSVKSSREWKDKVLVLRSR